MQAHNVSTNVKFESPVCDNLVDTEVEVPEVDYNDLSARPRPYAFAMRSFNAG